MNQTQARNLVDWAMIIGLLIAAIVVVFAAAGCSGSLATAPTPLVTPKVNVPVGFDINIPTSKVASVYQMQYPQGVKMSPVEAQNRWDYTAAYGGTPNVYYGSTSPKCEYNLVGIVVAPYSVASKPTFTASEWSIFEPGNVYEWVGRFVVADVARPGTYFFGILGCS